MSVRSLLKPLAVVLCVFCPSAESSEIRKTLAKELVVALAYQALFTAQLQECEAAKSAITDPNEVYRDDPNAFGGVSPRSVLWPKVELIYSEYRDGVCAYLTKEQFEDFFVDQYARLLSIENLRIAMQFYSTEAGRKLRDASLKANEAFQQFAQRELTAAYIRAKERARVRLEAIAREYALDPR